MEPHVDLATGKIYGCKRGSWFWWHEKGHLKFNDLPTTSRLKMWQTFIFGFWMFSMSLVVFNKYMAFMSIPLMLTYLGIDVYEELWCNAYASEHVAK